MTNVRVTLHFNVVKLARKPGVRRTCTVAQRTEGGNSDHHFGTYIISPNKVFFVSHSLHSPILPVSISPHHQTECKSLLLAAAAIGAIGVIKLVALLIIAAILAVSANYTTSACFVHPNLLGNFSFSVPTISSLLSPINPITHRRKTPQNSYSQSQSPYPRTQ